MNKTPNYQLNQWVADDQVLRADFNADNAKIDAALKALDTRLETRATQSALDALAQTVAGKAEILVGTYTGDGEASQIIDLGCTPRAVYIAYNGITFFMVGGGRYIYGGLVTQGQRVTHPEKNLTIMSLNGSHLEVCYDGPNTIFLNIKGIFHYIAIL